MDIQVHGPFQRRKMLEAFLTRLCELAEMEADLKRGLYASSDPSIEVDIMVDFAQRIWERLEERDSA